MTTIKAPPILPEWAVDSAKKLLQTFLNARAEYSSYVGRFTGTDHQDSLAKPRDDAEEEIVTRLAASFAHCNTVDIEMMEVITTPIDSPPGTTRTSKWVPKHPVTCRRLELGNQYKKPKWGDAVSSCDQDTDGRLTVGNDEYWSHVNFCPFCGFQGVPW